jgi:membrane protein
VLLGAEITVTLGEHRLYQQQKAEKQQKEEQEGSL